MLDPTDSTSSSTANIATVKRYAPPNQRNRSLGRRKSGGDRLERASVYASDVEKNQVVAPKNVLPVDHGDARISNQVNVNPHPRLIPLRGCCNSEAFHLLNDRWTAAMNAHNNPSIDLANRPVLYCGSGVSASGRLPLPHQQMASPTASIGPSSSAMDFLSELRRAVRNNANAR